MNLVGHGVMCMKVVGLYLERKRRERETERERERERKKKNTHV